MEFEKEQSALLGRISLRLKSMIYAMLTIRNGEKRYPKMENYEMSMIIVDLIAFAAVHLVPKGRLVFWLPTVNDFYQPQDIPTHPALKLIANSMQNFGKWSRRLITMEKISELNIDHRVRATENPGHTNFRDFYFNGTS
jgi:tRNA (guanine10-N2)-methyltransferase